MRFAAPENFLWLWVLIPYSLFAGWALLHRKRKLKRFLQDELLSQIAQDYVPRRQQLKFIFIGCAVFLSIIALARPQWGYEVRDIKRRGTDILLVVDVSRSMLTRDVKPTRLARTKLAIQDLLKKLKGDRVGLIAFAGDAFLMCPLTVDYDGFLLSLEDLNPDSISRGGTNIKAALSEAMKEYDAAGVKHKAIVIITDGENLEDDPLPVVEKAKEKGIKIFSIGVGTKDGEMVQVTNQNGQTDFLKDRDGHFVKSRLDEALLQKIALSTGGIYVRASGAQFGLDIIYDREISKFEKHDFDSKSERRYFERFQFPLVLAFGFLLVELFLPLRRRRVKL